MGRLIDIDELKGCAIIRPMTHEDFEHIDACENLVSHNDIPTAFDMNVVISELENHCEKFEDEVTGEIAFAREEAIEIVRKGGVK